MNFGVTRPSGWRYVWPRGGSVERAQALGHVRHRGAEGDEIDLAEDGGDLDRDVLDVVARQQRQVRLQAARGLGLAQDRLAQLVEVEAQAGAASLFQVAPQVFLLARQDHVLRLVAQAGHDGWHDQAGQVVRHGAAQEQADALPPVHVLRHAVALEQVGELIGDALRAVAAEGLIGQRDRQLLAVRIGEHAGELAGLGALVGGLLGARLAQERFGQLDGAFSEGHARTLDSVYAHAPRGEAYLGWATVRRYGLCVFQPCGYVFLASSSETAVTMMTSSPCFQFTGVATLCLP